MQITANPLRKKLQEALLELGPSQTPPGSPSTLLPVPTSAVALLQQERAQHEVRNAKVLSLLRSKDEAIGVLESRCGEATAEAAQLQAQLQTAALQLEEAQERIKDLLDDKKSHKRKILEAESQREEAVAEAAQLRAAAARGEEAEGAIKHLSSELASTRDQVLTLTSALQAADELIDSSERERRALEAERQENRREVQQLRRHLLRLLGMARGDAEASVLVASHAQPGAGDWPPDASIRIAELEEANEALEVGLVAANLRIAGVDPSGHSSLESLLTELASAPAGVASSGHFKENNDVLIGVHIEDQDEIVRLSGEVADLGGKLENAEQERNHLEAAHSVAQRAAIQAESELQEALRREAVLKANEAILIEKLSAEETRAESAEALCVELQNSVDTAIEETRQHAEKEKELVGKCGELEQRIAAAALELAEATATKQKAVEKAEEVLRQCRRAKEQMLNAQAENDELKIKISELESKLVHAATKAAAQEAAGALVARRHRGGNTSSSGHGPVEELARSLEQAAEVQMELHKELQLISDLNSVHENTIQNLHGSISRLRVVLAEEETPSSESLRTAEEGGNIEIAHRPANSAVEGSNVRDISALREQLMCSLAAQKGQAAAFAVLIEEAMQRESMLEARIQEVDLEEEKLQRLENTCNAAVAAMQGALAQVALAEGSSNAVEALLRDVVNPMDLGQCSLAAANKLEDMAKLLAQQRHEAEGKSISPATALAATQRDVIAALSAQLAANRDTCPAGENSIQQHPSRNSPEDQANNNNNNSRIESLKGLCGLLLHQLEAIEAAAGGGTIDSLHAAVQSMQSTIIILQTEIATAPAVSYPPSSPENPEAALAPVQQDQEISAAAAETIVMLEQQVMDLTERLTLMTQRLGLLTAANEAAQTEACHSRAAVAELAEALQASHAEHEKALSQASTRELELTAQLEESQGECRKLLESLQALDRDQQTWEKQVNVKIATLQAQLEASVRRFSNGNNTTTHKTNSTHQSITKNLRKGEAPTEKSRAPGQEIIPPGLGPLLDGLDALLNDASAMEERLRGLEAAAERADNERVQETQSRWEGMSTGLLRSRDVAAVWEEARLQIAELQVGRAKQAQRAAEFAERVSALESERDELLQRLEAVRDVHERQLQHAAELHAAQLAVATAAADVERQETLRRGEAAALAAAAAGEQRARVDLGDSVDNARRALEEAQRLCARLRTERDAVHAEFVKYREVKAAEVQLLEQRLGIFTPISENSDDPDPTSVEMVDTSTSDVEIAAAAGKIAAACRADAVAAALREAKMERSHRMQLQQALKNAQNAEKRAVAATRAAEKEIQSLRQRVRENTVAAEDRSRELLAEIEAAQFEAEEARKKAAHSAAEVEELLERIAGMAELAAHSEKERRQAAEREIHAARAALATRGSVIGELAGRVARAERGVESLTHDLDGAIETCSSTS